MFFNKIPTNQIVSNISKVEKDYKLEFVNADTNSDAYELSIYLRKNNDQHKIRLHIISNILAYPALEMIWEFGIDEYELASKTFTKISHEVDVVKEQFDQSMMPVATMAPLIKESVRWIAINHLTKKFILPLDESRFITGVADWRNSIYNNRYPNMTNKEKNRIKLFEGNEPAPLSRKNYGLRDKY